MRLVSTDNDAKKKSFGVLHFFFLCHVRSFYEGGLPKVFMFSHV